MGESLFAIVAGSATAAPMPPTVRVIIVNHNGSAFLQRCLDALAAQEGVAWEGVLVDNGSTDGSLVGLNVDPRIRVIETGKNLGFAAANNVGARGARTRWIACLNPDAFARDGWLAALVNGAAGAQMAGSTQRLADTPEVYDGLGDGYSVYGLAWRMGFGHGIADTRVPDVPYPVFGPCGAGALYDRELFERLGGFDESFFCYHEDVDLALRMRRAGGRAVQVPDAVIHHVSSGIAGRASDFAVYHGTRNRMWTFVKSMPLSGLILLGPLHVALTVAFLGWSLARPGRAGPTWRGVGHGLRGLPRQLRARRDVPKAIGLRGLWPVLAKNPRAVIAREIAPRIR